MSQVDVLMEYQLTFPRVQSARKQCEEFYRSTFQEYKINYPSRQLYVRVFKLEEIVEVWAGDNDRYHLIKIFNFTANSGKPGPKKCEGDLQIPEGFYQIKNFNPESKFHLSLRINYPNQADALRNKESEKQGGDIYIHGGNQTTGCIPIGDENINELYWLCIQSYAVNPFIPVHIFPCKMEEINLTTIYNTHSEFVDFWNSIKPMYQFFQTHKIICEENDTDIIGNYQLKYPDGINTDR
jgi:murein L,D-transpeptidase YafK